MAPLAWERSRSSARRPLNPSRARGSADPRRAVDIEGMRTSRTPERNGPRGHRSLRSRQAASSSARLIGVALVVVIVVVAGFAALYTLDPGAFSPKSAAG